MRAWASFLLLAGCASTSDVAPGLEVRLVARGACALGRPMPFALEATNRGSRAVTFDVQGLGHHPYQVRTADGRPVVYVDPRAGGLGTMQRFEALQPGETRVLDEIDIAASFAILNPGEVDVVFTGLERWGLPDWTHEGPPEAVLSALPPSAPLRLSVGPGLLGEEDRILRALLPLVPEGWILHRSGDGLTFLKTKVPGSGLRALVETRFAESKDAVKVGPLWVSPLRLAGKADRTPADDAIEAELRRTDPVPGIVARIR